ncbi:MAG: UvrD-helicase domain-containing protein [Nitrospirae bacterium]|nr:UvrD-helicase domain-containing protein [Nitrospirota bacterium]MBI3352039.1 UvrD-helicase domain-containing protein [Nitrospirota bacterium]
MPQILEKDTLVRFPHLTVLKASAGSGKTYTLTQRMVQFLLSEKIPKNRLRNILAITFSNNAAKEMKERTLAWLKEIHFGDEEKVAALSKIVSLEVEEMKARAGRLIDEILENYVDFQVKTIDSFMTTVFKASAIDFGYNPDFDILMDNTSLMEYAFNLFLRNVKQGSPEAAYLEKIVDSLLEYKKQDGAYLWIPSTVLLEETKKIYTKVSAAGKEAETEDTREDLEKLKRRIASCVENIEKEIERSGLKRSGNSAYKSIPRQIREKSFQDLTGKAYANVPVTKPSKGKADEQAAYDRIAALWEKFKILTCELTVLLCRSSYTPYVKTFQSFTRIVDITKKQQGKIFIGDINSYLAEYLNSSIVPDVYFRIGEIIYHFLIDEFQDTSPIQWRNLFPLIENSLAQGGSLFVVGDTKQSIYGFRNADYTIMKELEGSNPFPSAEHSVKELDTNYRSKRKILEFNERVFKTKLAEHEEYQSAGEKSGLTDYIQNPEDPRENDGYVEVSLLERREEEPAEREKIQELIKALRSRGHRYRDIAVLTQTNEHAVKVTSWLNEKDIPFISYSSLDIRRRKITGEIMAFINFLDSPTDDFSFGAFILGELFNQAIRTDHPEIRIDHLRQFCFSQRDHPPLYKAFQERFRTLWEKYFEGLFRVSGFLPIYDLMTELFAVFKVFERMPEEEAALIKFLEVVKAFESQGSNSLTDFLAAASGGETGDENWDMAVPKNIEAVSLMTIHKAKGLGFPVVIVLLYEVKNRGFDYILEEKGQIVHLLKINKDEAECDDILRGLYDTEKMREMVNRLNSLYVGFTRPQRELYVVGVTNKPQNYPFVLLPVEEYPPSKKPEYHLQTLQAPAGMDHCRIQHRSKPLEFPSGHEGLLSVEERKRGDFIHRVLFFVDDVREGFESQLQEIIRRVKEETGFDTSDADIKDLILAMVNNREIGNYFAMSPGREIRKEQEYSDGTGKLFRMDRVVIDPENLTVIDYKTGKDRGTLEKYQAQLRNYMKILGEIYHDKIITGLIAFVDLNEVEKVL